MNRKWTVVLLLLCAICYVVPVFYSVRNLSFRLDTDYDVILSTYSYIFSHVREYGRLPATLPYAGFGLAVPGDPFLAIYNPIFFMLLTVFGVQTGIKLVIFTSVVLSGITMMMFLQSLRLQKTVVWWGALLYMFSGTFAARVAAGHGNFFFSHQLWPLFFYCVLQPVLSMRRIALCAATIALIFLSGDVYAIWFMAIFFITTRGWFWITQPNYRRRMISQSISLAGLTLLLSLVKLYPMVTQVLPIMTRSFAGVFGQGSIHLPIAVLPFFIPWRVMFYDRPFFQRTLDFYFNWYEYYAFISPLPLLFFFNIRRVKHKQFWLLLIIVGIGLLYVAQQYPYSPFYWLFQAIPALATIRVPQRMYMPLTSIVIAILAIVANAHQQKLLVWSVFIGSVLWTFIVGQQTMAIAFESPRIAEQELVKTLKQQDSSKFFVANFVCCNQLFLVEEKIHVLNFYAAWKPKTTPSISPETLPTIRPTYIIGTPTANFSKYNYSVIFSNSAGIIWKTQTPNIFPL